MRINRCKGNFDRLHSSGKDATMDNEMKAKVEEFMKAQGTRELSLDEMDKVSGGKEYPYPFSMGPYYYIHDDASLNNFIHDISLFEAQFGKDVVASMLMDMFPSGDIKQDYLGAGLAGLQNSLYHIATNTLDKKGPFW